MVCLLRECGLPQLYVYRSYLSVRYACRLFLHPDHDNPARQLLVSSYAAADRFHIPRLSFFSSKIKSHEEFLGCKHTDSILVIGKAYRAKCSALYRLTAGRDPVVLNRHLPVELVDEVVPFKKQACHIWSLSPQQSYQLAPYLFVDSVRDAAIRARFRFNVIHSNQHLFSTGLLLDPACFFCPLVPENRSHILLSCPYYNRARRALLHTLRSILPNHFLSVPLILGNPSGIPKDDYPFVLRITGSFLRFIQRTRLL